MTLGMPAREDVLIGCLLERNAEQDPNALFVRFEDGERWTRREARDHVRAAANRLLDAGVTTGDTVAIFLPNGAPFLLAFWGAAMIGATVAPINTAFRGHLLDRLLELATPNLLIVAPEFEDRLSAELASPLALPRLRPADLRDGSTQAPILPRQVEIGDTQSLMMTSGTTGPAKMAKVSYLQTYYGGAALIVEQGLGPSDVFQVDLPLFHMSAQYYSTACLATGTGLSVRSRPSLDNYWEIARETGATCGVLLSTMIPYLLARPESAADRAHKFRIMIAAPMPADVRAFKQRFGDIRLISMYGSTEVPACMVGDDRDAVALGYCGKQRAPFDIRLVDADDVDVPDGQPGEAVVLTDWPWLLTKEYVGDPPAAKTAWRSGWFHTGDILRKDAEGRYFFVERSKDALRRRGEMISPHEIELVVAAFPSVAEAACVAHPSDSGVEDDVKVWVVPKPESTIDFEALLRACVAGLPHFMVPRYFETTDELPKTPSLRVQKYQLRERGNGPDTWDAQAKGFTVTRRGLELATR